MSYQVNIQREILHSSRNLQCRTDNLLSQIHGYEARIECVELIIFGPFQRVGRLLCTQFWWIGRMGDKTSYTWAGKIFGKGPSYTGSSWAVSAQYSSG